MERLLDLVEPGGGRDAAEAEPRDLVEGRPFFGEARDATGNRDHETSGVRLPAAGGLAAPGDQPGLGTLDAGSQGGVAEERQSFGVHHPATAFISWNPTDVLVVFHSAWAGLHGQCRVGYKRLTPRFPTSQFGKPRSGPADPPSRVVRCEWRSPRPPSEGGIDVSNASQDRRRGGGRTTRGRTPRRRRRDGVRRNERLRALRVRPDERRRRELGARVRPSRGRRPDAGWDLRYRRAGFGHPAQPHRPAGVPRLPRGRPRSRRAARRERGATPSPGSPCTAPRSGGSRSSDGWAVPGVGDRVRPERLRPQRRRGRVGQWLPPDRRRPARHPRIGTPARAGRQHPAGLPRLARPDRGHARR